jgi:hypothetical protein
MRCSLVQLSVKRRAVTSISIFILGLASPAEIIIAAGRISPKYLRRMGQQREKSSPGENNRSAVQNQSRC